MKNILLPISLLFSIAAIAVYNGTGELPSLGSGIDGNGLPV